MCCRGYALSSGVTTMVADVTSMQAMYLREVIAYLEMATAVPIGGGKFSQSSLTFSLLSLRLVVVCYGLRLECPF